MKYLGLLLLVCAVASAQTKPQLEAKPTDGVEPIYTVVPVTQKVPSCNPGYKLMHFDPAFDGSTYTFVPVPGAVYGDLAPHPARWVDTPPPNADDSITFGDYKCFPDPKAKTEGHYLGLYTAIFGDGWKPVVKCKQDTRPFHYKNCKLENGATLTDVVNALTEERP